MKTFSEKADNTSFGVTIEEGYAVLKANNTGNRNYVRYNYNSGNSCFSCYASTSSINGEVVIYVLEGSGEGSALINDPPCPTPTIYIFIFGENQAMLKKLYPEKQFRFLKILVFQQFCLRDGNNGQKSTPLRLICIPNKQQEPGFEVGPLNMLELYSIC